jgi:hypothetical protein
MVQQSCLSRIRYQVEKLWENCFSRRISYGSAESIIKSAVSLYGKILTARRDGHYPTAKSSGRSPREEIIPDKPAHKSQILTASTVLAILRDVDMG